MGETSEAIQTAIAERISFPKQVVSGASCCCSSCGAGGVLRVATKCFSEEKALFV